MHSNSRCIILPMRRTRTAFECDTMYAYNFTMNSRMLTAQLRLNATASCAGVAPDDGQVVADVADLLDSAAHTLV